MSAMRTSRSSAYVVREAILKFYDDKKLWPRGLTSTMECIRVLDRLPSIGEPAPVPLISEQYVKTLKGAAKGEKPKASPPKSAGFRFSAVFLKKAKKDFNDRSKKFREDAKAAGHAPRTALKMWIDSEERSARRILSGPLDLVAADMLGPIRQFKSYLARMVVAELLMVDAPSCLVLSILLLIFNSQIPKTKAHLRGASVDIVNEPVTMDLLTLRWVIEQPDGSFLPEMPRFQALFRTFEDLIDTITERAGFMSREEMSRFAQKTAVQYTDSNGVKEYTKAFGEFLTKYFVSVMKEPFEVSFDAKTAPTIDRSMTDHELFVVHCTADSNGWLAGDIWDAEMPTVIGYLNAKHVMPPGQWETWLG
ncbi:unnamed protein product [Symbiodinium sp. CCMP2456]|nr:unnamed protein product [Symbiodinium sp. CCMP2456]